ncbi:hypothetical protein [Paraburkholderia sp. BCC1876]|uniref:hypothetical protein n=1 Tax=Paraburkholderia sp. BCC1876 TaxID=2676303 RepID=UPI001591865A|nr:hypothetical protein [Paraburkholderia sp. BCC1876]
MDDRVFLLKPCRATDAQPAMSPVRVAAKQLAGIETCVILDLNILNRFKEYLGCSAVGRSEELRGDIESIKKYLDTPFMLTAAGFALGEADESYLDVLVDSYESFLKAELPGYVDAPNSVPAGTDRARSRKYLLLPESEQQLFSVAHLALLKIHDILIHEKKASPEARFDLYLEYMDGVADVIPGIETEVAKHCFFVSPEESGDEFTKKSRSVRKNFNKGGKGEVRVDRVLNGARDIMYIRSAAMMDGKSLDGKVQDTWLLTCDAGVAALSNLIYFYPVEGERAKFTTFVDSSFREKNSFWRYADRTTESLLKERSSTRHNRQGFCDEAHIRSLTDLARELSVSLAKPSQV